MSGVEEGGRRVNEGECGLRVGTCGGEEMRGRGGRERVEGQGLIMKLRWGGSGGGCVGRGVCVGKNKIG